jgi:hypothetical protein
MTQKACGFALTVANHMIPISPWQRTPMAGHEPARVV